MRRDADDPYWRDETMHPGTRDEGHRTSVLLVEDSASLAMVYREYLAGDEFDIERILQQGE